MTAAAIETAALTKSYGSQRGIDAVTLTVERGEVFGFLGPNGAGKTTMIRTLLDLIHPTSGAARIFGLDTHADATRIRARIGNLPGGFAADPQLTGRELLELLAGIRGMRDLGRATELATRFHADLDRPLGWLSRGNRQKIGLIQALFHEPDLLLLDEPTSGLDPLMQEQFLELISEERDRGCTVFVSSHALAEVERACDRVGIIRSGRLIAVESVGDLTRRAYRHVEIEFDEAADAAEFASLEGVEGAAAGGNRVSFKLSGPIDPVLRRAAEHTVRDIEVTHATLEEIFLGYYEEPVAA